MADLTETSTDVGTNWTCKVCLTSVVLRRPLTVGQSAAETTTHTVNDVEAVRSRHKHEQPPA